MQDHDCIRNDKESKNDCHLSVNSSVTNTKISDGFERDPKTESTALHKSGRRNAKATLKQVTDLSKESKDSV